MSKNKAPMMWRLVHWIIIANLLIQIAYAGYMVFFIVAPAEGSGPLFETADAFPFEKMVTRRLYAIECWIAIAGLSIYLAITEIGPRFRSANKN